VRQYDALQASPAVQELFVAPYSHTSDKHIHSLDKVHPLSFAKFYFSLPASG